MYKAFYIINTAFLLHVSATLVAILREVYYKGWILQDITNTYICEPMHKCKTLRIILSNIHYLQYTSLRMPTRTTKTCRKNNVFTIHGTFVYLCAFCGFFTVPNLCTTSYMRGHVSYPYKKQVKLQNLIFML